MNSYQYTAKDKFGRTINGVIEGVSEAEVTDMLHKRDLVVLSVDPARKKHLAQPAGSQANIKPDDLVIFSRQLATMINAGITLVHALEILADQIENKNLKNVIIRVRQDIEAGVSFSEALAKHKNIFSELYVNMVKAGETSGMLDDVLDRLATYMEKSVALSRKIRSSLVYPAIVVAMAAVITAFLLINVVPTFKGIFDALGGALPLPTQILIFASNLLRKYFLFLAFSLIIAGFLLKRYMGTQSGRYNFDSQILNLPVVGQLFRKLAIAKFSRTFSTLVKSGVSVLNTLEIVSKTAGNKIIEEALVNCSKSVRDGEPISKPLAKSGVFPPMVWRMIKVGEQTGQLEKMLSKIADFYDEQVDAQAAALTSIIEPLVIAFLGIVIGGIVISLFLPIFKITQLIAR